MIGEITRYVPICTLCEKQTTPAGIDLPTRETAIAALWPGELCFRCYCKVKSWCYIKVTDPPAGNDVLPETASEKQPPAVSDTGHFALDIEADICRTFYVPPYIVMSTPPEQRGRIARVFDTRRKARR